MAEMTVKQQVTKEETRDAIFETLNRFKKLILDINDNSKSVKGSELDRLASQMAENNFISIMTKISHWDLKKLDSEGHRQLLSICGQLSEKYSLGISVPKDVEVLEVNDISFSADSWKLYLSENNEISKIKYGSDKTKAQIIHSDGKADSVIEMTGLDYEGKGFAKKLLTAAGLEATATADLELQEKMLNGGLFYINREEGWIEKEKYFKRMTPQDFLAIQDYKDVTVKAVYEDAKGELKFTYTAGGKTENLFVIKASNRQIERKFPSKSGTISDNRKADSSNTYASYIPGKFPKGNWDIISFKEINDTEYGPYKIRTNAFRHVEAWDYVFDEDLDTKVWKKRLDKNGNVIKIKDEGLLIHGGGYSESDLDNKKGSNKYTDTTLGCIRISNLDVYLIVHVLQNYIIEKGNISLEVK